MQYYSNVADGVVEDNLVANTNQGLMTSNTDRLEPSGRVRDPQFRNAPVGVFRVLGQGQSTAANLKVHNQVPGNLSVGHFVEVDGDGVARRVTSLADDHFSIEPALASPPSRTSLVTVWSDRANLQIDTRPQPGSPALSTGPDGGPVGWLIDVPAYQRGDFDGDGQRDLPESSPTGSWIRQKMTIMSASPAGSSCYLATSGA